MRPTPWPVCSPTPLHDTGDTPGTTSQVCSDVADNVTAMTENTAGDTPGVIDGDAPPGNDYSREQAARVLGISPRRVTQLAQGGPLQVVQESPLRLSAESVHAERERRRSVKRDVRTTVPPPDTSELIADQVSKVVEVLTKSFTRQIEMTELARDEVAAERDRMREDLQRLRDEANAEAERLRAEIAAERERAELERVRAERERERVQAWERRRWWQSRPRENE